VFDPYYTTKSEQHHGLGLAVAYFVVRKHDGHILVDSEPDVSTVFSIYLPSAAAEEAPVRESGSMVSARAGGGKILVMDDEEIVRDVLGKILARFGYDVTFTRHGMEAVEEYRRGIESGNRFDAVIMDLTVAGGMGGREAIELLRLVDPGATAIVSSGYSDDFVMADYRKYGFDGVIAKPYRAEELSEVLAKVLGRGR
jgi:two-component system, cell cycle sensor histidine kinase and response regulator CckA